MKGKVSKFVLSTVALVLVTGIVITTVILRNSDSVNANVAFTGVKDIVARCTKDKPYNIVEIVPDKSMAKLGYLIEGEEPVDWLTRLSKMYNNPDVSNDVSRVDYVNSVLREQLLDITDGEVKNSNPLHFEEYKEQYAIKYDEEDKWNVLKLAGVEQIPKGTQGYIMEDVGKTNGDYSLNRNYTPLDTPKTGAYNQNIENYVNSGKGYYGLAFASLNIEQPFIDYFGENGGAYKVKNVTGFANLSSVDAYKQNNPHAAIYSLPKKNVALPYEFVGYIDLLTEYDFDNNFYFVVEMEYIKASDMETDKVYYDVLTDEWRFFADQSGEYSAILDINNPYYQADINEMGYFELDESSEVYTYEGPNKGSYILSAKEDGQLDYPVNVNFVYYQGGFSNNNWFKYGVFNQDNNTINESSDIALKTEEYSPIELNSLNISTADLIYINATPSSISERDETGNLKASGFNSEEDITWKSAVEIYNKAVAPGFYMPVILDGSLTVGTVDAESTNIRKLAALLCATNKEEISITEDTDPLTFDWNSLKYMDNADNYLSDSNYGYVNSNIYVIPPDRENRKPFICNEFHKAFLATPANEEEFINAYKSIGFEEIATHINEENLIRKTENNSVQVTEKYEYYDLDISKAIAIEYIICYTNRRVVKMDNKLNILDIEPCTVYPSSNSGLKYNIIQQWLGDNCPAEEDIIINTVSSSEFIGRIEDLNDYDLIYFGLATDRWAKDNQGRVVHNDPALKNMIYSNVGDLVIINPTNMHSGLIESDYYHDENGNRTGLNTNIESAKKYDSVTVVGSNEYIKNGNYIINGEAVNTYRASGNDITSEKVKKLNEYIYGGYPVIFHDQFYSDTSQVAVNEEYIDNCSNIYEFLKSHIDNKDPYVMSSMQVKNNPGLLYKYLTTDKPCIELFNMNTVEGKDYVSLDSSVMDINFCIDNTGGVDVNALFDVTLLLDANSDGKFSNTKEYMAANEIRVYKNGIYVEPLLNEQTGKYYYQLPAGKEYKYSISYTLPESFIGIIPWKLKVNQANNVYRYDSEQGYFYRKRTTTKRELVKILHISAYDNPSFNLGYEANTTGTEFNRLISELEDYQLSIRSIGGRDLQAKYAVLDPDNPIRDENKIYYEDYDMLIIGFKDMYHLDNGNGAVDGIKEYIKSGRPVLFTHDTTSMNNNSLRPGLSGNQWGYYFNNIIREVVGMDRYGILDSTELKNIDTKISQAENPESYQAAVEYAENNKKDLAYLPGSNKTIITRQNQGFTYLDLNRYMDGHCRVQLYKKYDKNVANDVGLRWNSNGRYGYVNEETTYTPLTVSQVNKGQITTYPYKLPETFEINRTHMQYYQLDMNKDDDRDGESDIVVWYTLGDETTPDYNTSLKDVRNNYYIYTMGNVTYSGVGHSNIKNNINEMKLYINTMIAAYSSKYTGPKIFLKENEKPDSPLLKSIDVPIDSALRTQIDKDEGPFKIYFTVNDTNIVRNATKTVYADFYIPVEKKDYDSSNGIIVGGNIYLKKIDADIKVADKNSAYSSVPTTALVSGITYEVELPRSLMTPQTNYYKYQDVYCVAYTRIETDDGKVTNTNNSYESFRISPLSLSPLD